MRPFAYIIAILFAATLTIGCDAGGTSHLETYHVEKLSDFTVFKIEITCYDSNKNKLIGQPFQCNIEPFENDILLENSSSKTFDQKGVAIVLLKYHPKQTGKKVKLTFTAGDQPTTTSNITLE